MPRRWNGRQRAGAFPELSVEFSSQLITRCNEAYRQESDQAIEDHQAADFQTLKRALPNAQTLIVSLDDEEWMLFL